MNQYDFNILEKRAKELTDAGRPHDAIRIYFFMADGDSSLDGGYLSEKIAQCYESMGQLYAAKYWYGRAVEENPEVRRDSAKALKDLDGLVTIEDLLAPAPRAGGEMKALTEEQAYAAMFYFLDRLWSTASAEDTRDVLGGMLGGMSLLRDGGTADPAVRHDWDRAVDYALKGGGAGRLVLNKE
ncbi:MAG: hypothetical protein ACAH83_15170 [Alphaproteobacteria bacterium]